MLIKRVFVYIYGIKNIKVKIPDVTFVFKITIVSLTLSDFLQSSLLVFDNLYTNT